MTVGTDRPARWIGAAEVVLAARMGALAGVLPVLLRVLSLPRLMRVLDPGGPPSRGTDAQLERHLRVAQGLFRNARRRMGSNCMRRSLVLFRFLRRAGFPASIVFGITRDPAGALDGHAWIELDGEPILEPDDPRQEFAVAFAYPVGDRLNGNEGAYGERSLDGELGGR